MEDYTDDLRPEYDLSQLRGGIRGKYANRFAGTAACASTEELAMNTLRAINSELSTAIDEFFRHFRPTVPRPEVIQITDAEWEPAEYERNRREHRYYHKPGVYILYSTHGAVLYVGKGMSEKSKLDRCWANDCEDRRWILAVAFDPEWDFIVPSLEVFLIRRLAPKHNILDK